MSHRCQLCVSEGMCDRQCSQHLVLDLDHTLINSVEIGEAYSNGTAMIPVLSDKYCDEDGEPELFRGEISGVLVLIKFRPAVRLFLRNLANEGVLLHVYTKGARVYMNAILSVLDPNGELIRGARCSRDDELGSSVECRKDTKHLHRLIKGACISHPSNHHHESGHNHNHPTHPDHESLSPKLFESSCEYFCACECSRMRVLDDSPHIWSETQVDIIQANRFEFTERFVRNLRLVATFPHLLQKDSGNAYDLSFPEDRDRFLISDALPLILLEFGKLTKSHTDHSLKKIHTDLHEDAFAVSHKSSFASTVDKTPRNSFLSDTDQDEPNDHSYGTFVVAGCHDASSTTGGYQTGAGQGESTGNFLRGGSVFESMGSIFRSFLVKQ